jgi:EAL domain-containing protein (putative c-di-GMP-specific phosphodiesterase class I)
LLADQIDQDMRHSKIRTERIQAIANLMNLGQPTMVYQPIYDLNKGDASGLEALSRFDASPIRAPDMWFAEAAAVGLGPELEGYAATKGIGALDALPEDMYVAINASPEFILSGALGPILHRVDIKRVVLEITEHASVANYDLMREILTPLRTLGLRVSIDDTGAGYSSMRHILNIEPNLVKLDISLTRGIDQDRKRRALASALIAFAKETHIEIIAEGVETAAELATLQQLGVSQAQGYHLARPAPLHEIPLAAMRRTAADTTRKFDSAQSGLAS